MANVNPMDNQKLDEVVELIAQRVAVRLQQMGMVPGAPAEYTTTSCVTPGAPCNDCGHCAARKPEAVQNIIASGATRIGTRIGINGFKIDSKLAGMIDHTILKPDATHEQLTKMAEEAKKYGFATVCVNSANIPLIARLLQGSPVKAIAVVGFPLGAATTQSKAFEAKEAIRSGAQEIDMVINIGALKSKDYRLVFTDIQTVVDASKPHKVKVIIETSQLTNEEKVIACALSKTAGAAFVKTSTGFAGGGATVEDIELMRRVVGTDMEIKASGGIRTREDAEKMINAGADRIGASAGVAIVTGQSTTKGTY